MRDVAAPLQPRFDLVVYLTADVKVRAERLTERMKDDPQKCGELDKMVINAPAKFVELDASLQRLVEEHSTCVLVVNTTNMSEQEVLDKVWANVQEVIAQHETRRP